MRKVCVPWLTTERTMLRTMWEAGEPIDAILKAIPRHDEEGVMRLKRRLKLHRPDDYIPLPRASKIWKRIHIALTNAPGMSIADLVVATGATKSMCTRLLERYHGHGAYVRAWRYTTRKPAALWALGHEPDAVYIAVRAISRIYPVRRKPVADPFASLIGQLQQAAA